MKNLLAIARATTRRSTSLLALLGLWLGNSAVAQTATFDFDTATPALTTGQNVPFDQTSGAVTAHFSASSGGFSVQHAGSTYLNLSLFSGNYLYPNEDNGVLVIQFNEQITNLAMAFATAEQVFYKDPTPIRFIAYTNSTSTPPVGSTNQAGTYFGGNALPMGTLTFNSATPFNLVTISFPPGDDTGLLMDNLVVKVSGGTVFTIATSAAPEDGGTTTGDGNYLSGAPVTVSAEPNPGFAFVNWTEYGIEVSTLAHYSFTANAFVTLVANFVPTYDLDTSASPLAGGTTSGDGNYSAGAVVNVRATATSGNVFVNWMEEGVPVSTWANYLFTVNTNRSLVANFAAAAKITTSSASTDAGFTLGDGEYALGSSVTVVATPNTGYRFVDWTQNDVPVSTAASYTFNAGTNRVLVGNFTTDPTSFTFDFDTGEPTLSIGQTTPFEQAAGELTAYISGTNDPAFSVANDFISGWVLSKFLNNYLSTSMPEGVLDIQFSQPVTKLNLTFATFDFQDVVAPTPLRLTAYANSTATPAVGTITATGTHSGNDSMPMGTLAFASATPFSLVRITLPPSLLGTTEFMVDNLNVQSAGGATYAITTSANPGAGGSTSGDGLYSNGASVTVVATAHAGFGFLNWTDGGVEVSRAASYSFDASEDQALVANFVPRLGIGLTNATALVISWPAAALGYVLQEKSELGGGLSWGANTNTVSVVGDQSRVFISPLSGKRFYRLFHH